jgi:2-phosphosulfolactate phosphatase
VRVDEQPVRTVTVDCFPESLARYRDGYAIVAVDVIRATTTAVTGVVLNRRCFPTPSIEVAVPLAARLDNPLLVGELGGNMPYGFHLTNSPAALALREDVSRPMILLSTAGTKVLCAAGEGRTAVYAACLRNYTAQVRCLAARHSKVAVIGAGTRGEFREEDQICCAWIAERLIDAGYRPGNEQTEQLVERWSSAPLEAFLGSKSVEYLTNTGQLRDLDFILEHIDDIDAVFPLENGEITMQPACEYVEKHDSHSSPSSWSETLRSP